MSLINIANDYYEILNNLEFDEEGNLIGLDRIDDLSNDFRSKAENVAQYIKELGYRAEALKREEQTLSERRKSAERKAEYLKDYLSLCMDIVGQNKLETDKCKISFRRSESVNITDFDKLPEEYKRTKTVVEADKTAIKDALKTGADVIGAELVEKQNIQIK